MEWGPELQHPIAYPSSLLVSGSTRAVLQRLGLVLRISCYVSSLLRHVSAPPLALQGVYRYWTFAPSAPNSPVTPAGHWDISLTHSSLNI